MATLTAGVDLNLQWRGPSGRVYQIVADKQAGTPLPAGTRFEIDDADLEAFVSRYGTARPNDASVSATGRGGLISGLTVE